MTALNVIVLGATSAIAEATCRLYAQERACLLLVGRSEPRLAQIAADLRVRGAESVETEVVDLACPTNAAQQFEVMRARLRKVDHVLLFYGSLGDQKTHESDLAAARENFATNFTSAAEWALAAANVLEAQGAGSLVVIGSVAGDRGRQSNYVYGAAKAGLGVLVEGIAHRLAQNRGGARAVLIKPGFVDTPMTAGLKKGGPLWATPERIAAIVRKAADSGRPVQYAPWFWRYIMLVVRNVPSSLFHRLKL